MSAFFKSRPHLWLWWCRDSWKTMANSTRGGLEGREGKGPFLKGHFICAHPASEVWQSLEVWKWPDRSVASQSLCLLPEMASVVLHWWPVCCPCQRLPQSHEEGARGTRAGRTEPGTRVCSHPPSQDQDSWGDEGRPGWDMAGSMPGQGRTVGSWRLPLLQHDWSRGWWPWGTEIGFRAMARVGETLKG